MSVFFYSISVSGACSATLLWVPFNGLMNMFQIEEEAISQLLQKYGAHERADERITVERVSGPIEAPLWNLKRSNSSSHP